MCLIIFSIAKIIRHRVMKKTATRNAIPPEYTILFVVVIRVYLFRILVQIDCPSVNVQSDSGP